MAGSSCGSTKKSQPTRRGANAPLRGLWPASLWRWTTAAKFLRNHRKKRVRRCDCRVARRDGARCILEQGRKLSSGFGRKIVAGEIEVHDILHFVYAAHHGPRWRTCIRTSIADASPVIATNVEKARDHNPALHHVQTNADRFDQSADHVAV
jgi:hypothetical protein